MSYCFNAKGKSKSEAILDAEEKFRKVVRDLNAHELDHEAALSNLRGCVNLLPIPSDNEVAFITMSGHILTNADGSVSTVSVSCTASVGPKAL